MINQLQIAFQTETTESENWRRQSHSLEQQLQEQIQLNQRQAKDLEAAKLKQKLTVDNMLSAQKQINDMLQLSPSQQTHSANARTANTPRRKSKFES